MHDQSISASAAPVLEDGLAAEDLGEHPVVVLSAAVLRAARTGCHASQDDFARRAGVPAAVVVGVEAGTSPAWALSYCRFSALADAVAAASPWTPAMFETAAACDLLLSCVLDGDQVFAADVMTAMGTRDLAAVLLQWAITGAPVTRHEECGGLICPACGQTGQLLSRDQVTLLSKRAAALAASSSPDAWVGVRILAACRGDLP